MLKLSLAGKRSVLVLVTVLVIVTGLGATLMSQVLGKVAPSAVGPSVAPSSKALPASLSSGRPSARLVSQEQIDLLLLQLEEAWRNGDWNKAIEVLSTILAADPNNTQMRDRLYQAHVNLGWQLLVNQKFAEAKVQFSLALQIKADGIEALEGLRLVQQLAVTVTVAPTRATTAPPVVTPTPPPCTPPPVGVCTSAPPSVVCPVPLTAPCPSGFICHTVRTGDTLFSLARRFNTTVEGIMAANKLPSCTIFVCQRLLIPAGACQGACPTICRPSCCAITARTHVVQPGDNLFRLAIRFNTTIARIMQANGLHGTVIRVGQVLVIP